MLALHHKEHNSRLRGYSEGIFVVFHTRTFICTLLNCLKNAILMSTHSVCFGSKIEKKITDLDIV